MPDYLIQYGKPGFVGRYRCEFPLERGNRVVVRSPRGVEYGDVLVLLSDAPNSDGEVLRLAAGDEPVTHDASELFAAAVTRAEQLALPLAFVDVELTLDGIAILHTLPWASCDATPLLDELAARFALTVRLLDLSRTPTAQDTATGCGKPGCGSDSGGCSTCGTRGCSTGSCSRGAVTSADDLTAYFTNLRRQMEAARLPLN